MANKFSKGLKQALTSYDNQTYDTGRILAFLYFLSTIVFTGWGVFHGLAFDPQAYLVGGGGFLAGLGVYLFGDKEAPAKPMTKEPNGNDTP
jgi:hypothetical protein